HPFRCGGMWLRLMRCQGMDHVWLLHSLDDGGVECVYDLLRDALGGQDAEPRGALEARERFRHGGDVGQIGEALFAADGDVSGLAAGHDRCTVQRVDPGGFDFAAHDAYADQRATFVWTMLKDRKSVVE